MRSVWRRSGRPVVAEVEMTGVLAAEDDVLVAHDLLDQRVADGRAARHAAGFLDDLRDAAAADQIVEDRRAGTALERVEPDERDDHVAADQAAFLVDDEHAVRITVESDAQVAAVLEHRPLKVGHVGGLDRARRMIGERAVELEEQREDFARQVLEDVGHRQTGHPVAGVDGDLERFDRRGIDEGEAVRGEILEDFALADRPGTRRGRREHAARDLVADLPQTRLQRNRLRLLACELHAVVSGGIVRRGDHHAAAVSVLADREVERVGETRPMSVTSAPASVAPWASAAKSASPEGRMSRPTASDASCNCSTKARPMPYAEGAILSERARLSKSIFSLASQRLTNSLWRNSRKSRFFAC